MDSSALQFRMSMTPNMLTVQKGVRVVASVEYRGNPENIHQIAVLTIIYETVDELLWAVIGGSACQNQPCKVRVLVHRDTCLIGVVQQRLADLLDTFYIGGELREHWMLLDMLKCPVENPDHALSQSDWFVGV